jgi:2-polyprenyl-3-methyl-5-hydroxy-6-metoxy-1,4-benzoquinol methylase
MSDYRREFYERYRTTHVSKEKRKAGGTVQAHARRFPKWDRLIGPYLPTDKDAVIVDCGCGEGYLVSWLHARGFHNAVGVDASREEVAVAQSLGLRVECAEIAPFLASRVGSVDFLIFRNVLEHLYKNEVVEMLLGAHRALRSGGGLWIQVPNAESPFGSRLRYADFTHELAFTQVSISQVLRVTGFDGIQVGPVRAGFRGLRGLLWKVMEAFYRLMLTAELGKGNYVVTQDLYCVAHADKQ